MSDLRALWPVRRVRDLLIMEAPGGGAVVIACDSVGGIGPKPHDTFATAGRTVTHFAARVPLLEVIAAGAQPQVIVDTLNVERNPSGEEMIAEIRCLAEELGLDPATAVTGSTEDNVATLATGLGVTVIGTAPSGGLRLGRARDGDAIACIGIPLSAPRDLLIPGDPRMPSIREVADIARLDGVHELLPVGSRGVAHELAELLGTSGLTAVPVPNAVDLHHSAGPSTCVLAAVSAEALPGLLAVRADLPVSVVAHARR